MLYSPLKGPDKGAEPVHRDGKILQGNNHYQGPHFPPISAPYFSSFICLDVGPLSVISAESGLHFVKKIILLHVTKMPTGRVLVHLGRSRVTRDPRCKSSLIHGCFLHASLVGGFRRSGDQIYDPTHGVKQEGLGVKCTALLTQLEAGGAAGSDWEQR